jgi:hypothetical protein
MWAGINVLMYILGSRYHRLRVGVVYRAAGHPPQGALARSRHNLSEGNPGNCSDDDEGPVIVYDRTNPVL